MINDLNSTTFNSNTKHIKVEYNMVCNVNN